MMLDPPHEIVAPKNWSYRRNKTKQSVMHAVGVLHGISSRFTCSRTDPRRRPKKNYASASRSPGRRMQRGVQIMNEKACHRQRRCLARSSHLKITEQRSTASRPVMKCIRPRSLTPH